MGWDVVIVKYGTQLQAAFAGPGRGAAALDRGLPELDVRRAVLPGRRGVPQLCSTIWRSGPVIALIDRRRDDELLALMTNLGGHDMGA